MDDDCCNAKDDGYLEATSNKARGPDSWKPKYSSSLVISSLIAKDLPTKCEMSLSRLEGREDNPSFNYTRI